MNLTKTHVPMLNVSVTPLTTSEVLDQIRHATAHAEKLTILAHNLHSTHLFHTNDEFRQRCHEAEVILVDGMPILAALSIGRLRQRRAPLSTLHRVGSTDWVRSAAALPGIERIVLLGGTEAANNAAVHAFTRSSAAQVVGIPGDPWHDTDLPVVAAQIRTIDPQLLLIGMGMPLQERIAAYLRDVTDVPVTAAVGGALDQVSGTQSLAPRWLGRTGFEWAWRLASDPRRLAGRYLVEPFQLASTLMRRSA
ncbi:WecB/TagA/CpsF family glycosyltransferase [Garicola koreensis]|uniref:N-acetylglucosaminyldiphosphoundecaprenol N-acetyl-beta-D-mannosaminyltransferase n=1 Tax=Garicola koreensis TaxID=1262554 RepID=A0A7W5XP72_9MICC|nr:WecB/TagA/CpsF family glycosyltransferase [Garicola koreensis]MBB3667582.1 N-acetylglucosaminyldiphosphoundecaprenol N-acetyl-beta-D-mannosaminyltransferase [Garicola koreensis]